MILTWINFGSEGVNPKLSRKPFLKLRAHVRQNKEKKFCLYSYGSYKQWPFTALKTKKNSCKGKCQEKKFMQRRRLRKKIYAEGRSNCDFFRKSEFQKSTIFPGTIWINKNHFLLIERRQLEPCFCFNCS